MKQSWDCSRLSWTWTRQLHRCTTASLWGAWPVTAAAAIDQPKYTCRGNCNSTWKWHWAICTWCPTKLKWSSSGAAFQMQAWTWARFTSLLLFETYANVSLQICPFLALRPEFHSNHCVNSSTPRYCQSATFGQLTFCVYTLLFYGIRV